MQQPPVSRTFWTWWVCGLLLCASTINYMDRQTLANVSKRITNEFELSEQQYGYLETAFGLAFATGATVFGLIADRVNVRWLYPIVLLLWSLMGFLTGFVETYLGLLLCRLFLGFFEAGHWALCSEDDSSVIAARESHLGKQCSAKWYRDRCHRDSVDHATDADRRSWKLATGVSDHRGRGGCLVCGLGLLHPF